MKKVVAILMAALMFLSCTAALAENIKLDKLTFEFVPSKDADVIITGTKNLPQLVQAEMAKQTQRVLDTMNCNKMSEMQARINQLETANVINAATAGVVKYPMATTYSSGVNPFCGGANAGCCGQVTY